MNSEALAESSRKLIPGGVNSPVRAFNAVGGHPMFFNKSKGPYIYNVEGDEILDFVLSWGPGVLGHAPERIVKAVQKELEGGFCYGMASPLEVELADYLCQRVEGLDMVRFVNSGTEATMSAIRLARGFTGKSDFIKFEGCYHGHSDGLLVKAGSGVATFGEASSAGVPEGYTKHTIPVPYNDLQAVEKAFANGDIAAVIIEPVPGNMGVVPAADSFLKGLRELCDANGALLIFDEVMCGFRVSETTAASRFGIVPDLFCFGKVIGGGMPVGAFGGRSDVMEKLAPSGPVYQAGTLSGNPIAMRAGLETLKEFYEKDVFCKMNMIGAFLEQKIKEVISAYSNVKFTRIGSMFTLFFHEGGEIKNVDDVGRCDFDKFGRFFNFMLREKKILLPPSQYEANFLSCVHTEDHIQQYVDGVKEFLAKES
ncbi:MAG: glutamate-1-semialdehyde 2,1-aminomutase [Lentisphaeraceae bacterium]|nr:glutamate-1-semialdehyde 2,1-aminomutase [Lentisphaeraceae bacterium]